MVSPPAEATLIAVELPVMEGATVSVVLIVWLPAVSSVAEKGPVPFERAELDGKSALVSVLEKWTVPA